VDVDIVVVTVVEVDVELRTRRVVVVVDGSSCGWFFRGTGGGDGSFLVGEFLDSGVIV
jgi:hypothetical protein